MLRIELLSRRHNRAGFDCGNPELNDYLRHTARQHTEKGLSRTDVLVDDAAPNEILGYVTVSLAEIVTDSLPPTYAKQYPAKAHGVKLARLCAERFSKQLITLKQKNSLLRHSKFRMTEKIRQLKFSRLPAQVWRKLLRVKKFHLKRVKLPVRIRYRNLALKK